MKFGLSGTSLAALETRGPTMSPVSLQSLSDLPIKQEAPVKLEAMEQSPPPPPLTFGVEPQMPVLEAEPALTADMDSSPAENDLVNIQASSPPPVSPSSPATC